jgi:hypothetical protein
MQDGREGRRSIGTGARRSRPDDSRTSFPPVISNTAFYMVSQGMRTVAAHGRLGSWGQVANDHGVTYTKNRWKPRSRERGPK